MSETNAVKQEVQQFYDQVGWQSVSEDVYQNARYEDLRPVSREYIHRCHMRVAGHIQPEGRYMLDAGSGPVQYPEYMEYSRHYEHRVCADISIIGLKEARKRIGEHGFYVVADVACLPFKADAFDSVVSLHTIHHLPEEEQLQAFRELYRVLAPHRVAAVVNGWPTSRLMNFFEPLIHLCQRLRYLSYRLARKGRMPHEPNIVLDPDSAQEKRNNKEEIPKGTFTNRHDVAWIQNEVGAFMPIEIFVWRSVSVRFLRALIHPWLGGRLWLRLLFWLEERYPHYFGENGKYPLILIRKNREVLLTQ